MTFPSLTRRKALQLLGGSTCALAVAPNAVPNAAAQPAALTGAGLAPAAPSTDPVAAAAPQPQLAVSSAQRVLRRTLGERADQFELAWTPAAGGHPVYEIEASRGTVSVRGSSGVAICRGAYAYLREACHSMITWSGRHLDLPHRLPDYAAKRVVCPYRHTQYYNPCTFGYTTAFWNWQRWERELDWMALHGITMPMALEGQEAIWQQVWLSLGLAQADLDRFSTGPAQLPWHRFGNINYFNGPLPQGWRDGKRDLQKQILTRMRELGMTPIVPAFGGYVPEGFKRLHPEAETYTEFWGGAYEPRLSKTFFLDPRDHGLFREIGRRFIEAYNRTFGKNEYYMADPFNELQVPVSKGHRYQDLAAYGRRIYESVAAGDPDGTWVLQAWCFEDVGFWTPDSIRAFLSQVPDDRMLIIDYGNSTREIWRKNQAYFGKPWIYGMIHAFGGNNNIRGNLEAIDTRPAAVLASPNKGNLVGWGVLPEGIENNEVVYELMTDVGWAAHRIPLEDWLRRYSQSRYGACPPEIQASWKLLLQSVYGQESYNSRQAFQCRPSFDPKPHGIVTGPVFAQAVDQFVAAADRLQTSPLYRNDLIELVCQAVGNKVDEQLRAACETYKKGNAKNDKGDAENAAARDRITERCFGMLLRIDALMHSRPDRRLETWTGDARGWGRNPYEAAYYEADGRLLITYWGWKSLEDYASRVWSGLIRDYYVGRWRAFFEAAPGADPDAAVTRWEQTWLSTPYVPSRPLRVADVVTEAKNMLRACQEWTS